MRLPGRVGMFEVKYFLLLAAAAAGSIFLPRAAYEPSPKFIQSPENSLQGNASNTQPTSLNKRKLSMYILTLHIVVTIIGTIVAMVVHAGRHSHVRRMGPPPMIPLIQRRKEVPRHRDFRLSRILLKVRASACLTQSTAHARGTSCTSFGLAVPHSGATGLQQAYVCLYTYTYSHIHLQI